MPPTPSPMMKHIKKFHAYPGIEPQIEVPMKMMPAYRIEARRPMPSPSQPHINDPITVPEMPESGSQAAGTSPHRLSRGHLTHSSSIPRSSMTHASRFISLVGSK